MSINKNRMLQGAYRDTRALIPLIREAYKLCEENWSEKTFLHRTLGNSDMIERLETGRVAPHVMKSIYHNMRKYIDKRTKLDE